MRTVRERTSKHDLAKDLSTSLSHHQGYGVQGTGGYKVICQVINRVTARTMTPANSCEPGDWFMFFTVAMVADS